MDFTKEEFEELRLKVEEDYKKIGEVRCPFLDDKVTFDPNGFNHIRFKRGNYARSEQDQFTRLKLLHLAPEVIKRSHTLQGIRAGNRMERLKVNNKWKQHMVFVTYYEFMAILDNCRLRIIVKKINNNRPYFWSIVPFWKQVNQQREMIEGNSEED